MPTPPNPPQDMPAQTACRDGVSFIGESIPGRLPPAAAGLIGAAEDHHEADPSSGRQGSENPKISSHGGGWWCTKDLPGTVAVRARCSTATAQVIRSALDPLVKPRPGSEGMEDPARHQPRTGLPVPPALPAGGRRVPPGDAAEAASGRRPRRRVPRGPAGSGIHRNGAGGGAAEPVGMQPQSR